MEEFNENLSFLPSDQRQLVPRNIREINASDNSLYMGKRLAELNSILAPYGLWMKAIAATKLYQRTAYGYMYAYQQAEKLMPAAAVAALMQQPGIKISQNRGLPFGEWTDHIKANLPPASGSEAVYARWANELLSSKPKRVAGRSARQIAKSPDDVVDELTQAIERAFHRLPPQRAVRERVGRQVVEAAMQRFGLDEKKASKRAIA